MTRKILNFKFSKIRENYIAHFNQCHFSKETDKLTKNGKQKGGEAKTVVREHTPICRRLLRWLWGLSVFI